MPRYLNCWCCGEVYNVSVKAQYTEDNYTCPKCREKLTRNVKRTQPSANRIEPTEKIILATL